MNASAPRPSSTEKEPAIRPRGIAHCVVGIFLNVVIFVVVGPLVGGLLLMIGLGTALGNPLHGINFYLGFGIITVPTSYWLAATPAALTGFFVAVASIWISRPPHLYLFAAVAGLVSSFLFLMKDDADAGADLPRVLAVIAGGVAAMVCTRISRPFRLGPVSVLKMRTGDAA